MKNALRTEIEMVPYFNDIGVISSKALNSSYATYKSRCSFPAFFFDKHMLNASKHYGKG